MAGEIQNSHALVHVRLFGLLVALNFLQAAALLFSPLPGHAVEELAADPAVELVDVHGVDATLQPLVLGLETFDRLLMLPLLICVAGVERLAHPTQHLVVELQSAEQRGELLLQHFLTNIPAAA
ncbi:MAG: hypothetical protein JNM48_02645 [Rhodospirillales bacterium]|nr:hypothetical protein [Rhodospirillales bacterium]